MPRKRDNDDYNLLRNFRDLLGWTQEQAGEAVSVSRSLWSAWEGRARPMTVAQLNKIQAAMELSDDQTNEIRIWWGTEEVTEDMLPSEDPEPSPAEG
jgi:transcriptional regulator with XRE-family HTH domain